MLSLMVIWISLQRRHWVRPRGRCSADHWAINISADFAMYGMIHSEEFHLECKWWLSWVFGGGGDLFRGFLGNGNVDVAYLADVSEILGTK